MKKETFKQVLFSAALLASYIVFRISKQPKITRNIQA